MVADGVFGDLRRLADWFSTSPQRTSLQIDRITRRLGATAIPLLGREIQSPDAHRREAAREALAVLATTPARPRVIGALKTVTHDAAADESKVCALGLLSELGERAEATFADPSAMQRRSALALAAQLDTAADVANAVDLMVRQLDETDTLQMVEVLVEAAPTQARRLAAELALRLDVPVDQRDRIAAIVAPLAINHAAPPLPRRLPRPSQVAVLVDAAARLVVVATRKISGARRWRRWAVLIGATGRIEDCLHEDDATDDGDATPLIANLCADGYQIASRDLDHARGIVTTAARLTASTPERLTSSYYLGRDLLDLGDAHLTSRTRRDPSTITLGRAVDLIAAGEPAKARALLETCEIGSADVAAAVAACALAEGQPAAALEPLARAIAAEPDWPLHHWNLGVALHRLGDASGSYHAFRRFVAASAAPSGLYGDPDQPGRVACAERMLAEIARTARLTGLSLVRRRRKKPTRARR